MGRALIGASLLVAAGVAVNQIYDNGRLSWSWGYLALVFTVLGALVQAAPPSTSAAAEPAPPARPRRRRGGSRREYLRRMRSAVDQMETIGLVTQAEFVLRTRQVYVDVTLQPRPVTDVVTDTGIGPASSPGAGRRASLASFLAKGRVLAVLGAAGSGKTTLARYTALEMAEAGWPGRRRQSRLPVLLYLRDHADELQGEEPDDLARIAASAPWLRNVVSAEWLDRQLARGRCVVLLDGLDEVADARGRGRVVRWVERQVSRYPQNAFVVTSRPLGYDGNRLSRADVLHVQRFTGVQIRAFLHAWYRAIELRSREGDHQEIERISARAADDLFDRIGDRSALYDLAANPLLLTMIANVHRYRGSLPGSRAALYEEVCQVLLHRRQEAKNLTDTGLDALSGEKKERVVQELAWYMMRRRLRDVSAAEAERAIRTVLQRTAPEIRPEVFLDGARRSGLLLEHRHRHYGFAHLTLQEYLAAALVPAHASRRQLLVDSVSDSWWRETTLLWAARADASPVVAACLAARTVPALALAYACAEEARELDPDLRGDLDRLLNTAPSGPEEARLLDGVAAARALQETHALDDDGTRICADPIGDELWNRYTDRTGHDRDTPGPAARLWTPEIKRFLTWLNALLGDGTGYRLPTPSEAARALSGDLRPGTEMLYAAGSDWADDHCQARVVTRLGPHHHGPGRLHAYPRLILDHAHLVFRLLGSHSALGFGELLAHARARRFSRPEDRLVLSLDLALELAFDRELTRELSRDLVHEVGADLGLEVAALFDPGHDLDVDLDKVLEIVLRHVRGISGLPLPGLGDHDHGFRRSPGGLGYDAVRLQALGDVLRDVHLRDADGAGDARALRFRGFGQDLDRQLDQALLRDIDRELETAGDLCRDIAQGHLSPGRPDAWRIEPDIVGAKAHLNADSPGFPPSLPDVVRHLVNANRRARALDGGPPRGAAEVRDLRRSLSRARDLILAHVRGRAGDHRPSGAERASFDGLARDLAFARAAAHSDVWSRGTNVMIAAGRACHQLALQYTGTPQNGLAPFLYALLSQVDDRQPAHDPGVALRHAAHLARHVRDVRDLIEDARWLAAPLLEGDRQVRQSDMALSVTSVLAALSLSGEITPEPEWCEHLRGALAALVALTPEKRSAPENTAVAGSLILVRN